VKNRAPAPIQITAEQILREASERQAEEIPVPRQMITSVEELIAYRMRKRKEFEDAIRRQRQFIGTWLKYAKWEEQQEEFKRARSIFERVLDVEYTNPTIWRRYAEMEMKHKFVKHARNIWDRAVALLPRVDQLWYKYTLMEEMLGNTAGCRNVFERWMRWEPNDQAWLTFVKFEVRAKEIEKARTVYERYIVCHPVAISYIRYAKWEAREHQKKLSRKIFERSFEELPTHEIIPELYIQFAKFEEKCQEVLRCRHIYKHALDEIPKQEAAELYREFISFEKQHGSRKGIEDVIMDKRRFQYEALVRESPTDYDVWFDYIRLEETEGDAERIRETYERAIGNVPPVAEKRYWRRYIYLWINYFLFEELVAKDMERTREVYKACVAVVPHKLFTFAKIWTMWAQFEVRQKRLAAARKVFGHAIGRCPKDRLFKEYIQLELNLGNFDRCRKLYQKYLEFAPHNVTTWIKFAELETTLNELERTRSLYELGISQELLDKPEQLWKAYIDFEISQQEHERTRVLYERLLERTSHVKVFMSFAQFESSIQQLESARDIYTRAYDLTKREELNEECVLLLEDWVRFEESLGDEHKENLESVKAKVPRKIKKKRMIQLEDGTDAGWEEYYDYIFPDDSKAASGLKMLELAHKWKQGLLKAAQAPAEEDAEEDEDEDEIDLGDL